MKAEQDGNWLKYCGKCKTPFGADDFDGLLTFFTKDRRKPDGLDALCKVCRSEYRKLNRDKENARWSAYYKPGSQERARHIVRVLTRRMLGSASKHRCDRCGKRAEEWHHLKYEVNLDSVIPLCQLCHEDV